MNSSSHISGSYRTRDEVKEIRSKLDPITSFRDRMIDAELFTKDEVKVNEDLAMVHICL